MRPISFLVPQALSQTLPGLGNEAIYSRRYASIAGTARTNKPVKISDLAPAPVGVEEGEGEDEDELLSLLEVVAASFAMEFPPTPVELKHWSSPNVCPSPVKVISAH